MSDSSKHDGGSSGGIAGNIGVAILKGSVTAAVGWVLGPVSAAVTPKVVDGVMSAMGAVEG